MTRPARGTAWSWLTLALVATLSTTVWGQIPIEELARQSAVDFEREILPVLRQKCLACHSAREKQGNLVLESAAGMLQGGDSGPAAVAGKSGESLILHLAAHRQEPFMPPPKNEVNAQPLSPQELGLLRLWIDQGARGGSGLTLAPQNWRPLPPGVNPIQAVAITSDGQYAACTRANQIFIYHVATGTLVTRLTDPQLPPRDGDPRPGVAHWDLLQSLAFNSEGDLLASGSYREVKLWRRPRDVRTLQLAAEGPVTAVATSADGQWIATSGRDHAIRVWQATGALSATCVGHTDVIHRLVFLPDQRQLASAGQDGTLRIWNLADGQCREVIGTPAPVLSLDCVGPLPVDVNDSFRSSENTHWLVSGGGDNLVRVWGNMSQAARQVETIPADAQRLAVSQDGGLLACAAPTGAISVLDTANFAVQRQWTAPQGAAAGLAWLPARNDAQPSLPARLVSLHADGSAVVWHAAQGAVLDRFQGAFSPARSVAASADGKSLVVGYENGVATAWNLAGPVPTVVEGLFAEIETVAYSPSRNLLAAAGQFEGRPTIAVLDIAGNRLLGRIVGHEGPIRGLAFSADEARLASGSDDKTARIWNLRDAALPELARLAEHPQAVTSVGFSPDGQQLLTGCQDHRGRLWSLADNTQLQEFAGHEGPVLQVVFGPGNQPLTVGADRSVRFWNAADGQQQRAVSDPAAITAAGFSADGQRFALAGDDRQIRIYETASGRVLTTLTGLTHAAAQLQFSPDATRLLSGSPQDQSGSTWVLWDVASGQPLDVMTEEQIRSASFAGAEQLQTVAVDGRVARRPWRFLRNLAGLNQPLIALQMHADGQQVFAASQDGSLRGFRLGDGQAFFSTSHGAAVHDMILSPNGQWLATAGENGQVRTWNSANGSPLPQPAVPLSGPVRSVAFSADSSRVIATSSGEKREEAVFETATGAILERHRRHRQDVSDLIGLAAPPGQMLSVAPGDRPLLWPLHAVKQIAGHGQPVTGVAAIPQAPAEVLTGSLDGTFRRWNLLNGQQLQGLNHGGPVTAVAVRPDGQRYATTSNNHTAKLWNSQNGQQLAEMRGDVRLKTQAARAQQHVNASTARQQAGKQRFEAAEKDLPVKTEAEKKASEALAAANQEVTTKTALVRTTMEAKIAQEKIAIDAATAAQQALVAKQLADQTAQTSATLAQQARERSNRLNMLAQAAPNNAELARAAADAQKVADELQAKAQQATAAQPAANKSLEDATRVANEAAAKVAEVQKPYNEALAALKLAESVQNLAAQTQAITLRELQQAQAEVPAARDALVLADMALQAAQMQLTTAQEQAAASDLPLHAVAFSPDSRWLATAGDFASVHSWDGDTGLPIAAYAGHTAPLKSVAFLSNAQLVSGSSDATAAVWDVNPGWVLQRTVGGVSVGDLFSHRVTALDFSRDGKLLAVGSGTPSRQGSIHLLEVASGQVLVTIANAHDDTVGGLQFSPDGKRLASVGADKYLRIFDVATGQLVRRFEGHTNYVCGVAWKSDGQLLASCSADRTIKIWNPDTGDQLRTIENFGKAVTAVRFIGDTDNIVSSCGDGTLRMHNANNGGNFRNFGGAGYAHAVDISANSEFLIAGGFDSILRIWNGNNGQTLKSLEPPAPAAPLAP